MGWYVVVGRAGVVPQIVGRCIRRAMVFGVLKVGAVSCFSPLQGVLTISIFTHMLAGFGTAILAGYGIGARLEFLLTSVSFAGGIASVPMIRTAVPAPPNALPPIPTAQSVTPHPWTPVPRSIPMPPSSSK